MQFPLLLGGGGIWQNLLNTFTVAYKVNTHLHKHAVLPEIGWYFVRQLDTNRAYSIKANNVFKNFGMHKNPYSCTEPVRKVFTTTTSLLYAKLPARMLIKYTLVRELLKIT